VTGRTTILTMLMLLGLVGLVGCGEQDSTSRLTAPTTGPASCLCPRRLRRWMCSGTTPTSLAVRPVCTCSTSPTRLTRRPWVGSIPQGRRQHPRRAHVQRRWLRHGHRLHRRGHRGHPNLQRHRSHGHCRLSAGTTAVDGKGLCFVPPEVIGESYTIYLADSWKGVRVYFSVPDRPGVLDYIAFASTYGYTQALDVIDGVPTSPRTRWV